MTPSVLPAQHLACARATHVIHINSSPIACIHPAQSFPATHLPASSSAISPQCTAAGDDIIHPCLLRQYSARASVGSSKGARKGARGVDCPSETEKLARPERSEAGLGALANAVCQSCGSTCRQSCSQDLIIPLMKSGRLVRVSQEPDEHGIDCSGWQWTTFLTAGAEAEMRNRQMPLCSLCPG